MLGKEADMRFSQVYNEEALRISILIHGLAHPITEEYQERFRVNESHLRVRSRSISYKQEDS
jgi:hypothetical protein